MYTQCHICAFVLLCSEVEMIHLATFVLCLTANRMG